MNKRKMKEDAGEGTSTQRRRRSRSSKPLQKQTKEPKKRQVLRRLFCRDPTNNIENSPPRQNVEDSDSENDDPLLSNVPVNLVPVQLGFLVGAQETLRFLHGSGITADNPLFQHLRSHLLRGMHDIGAA